MNTIKWIIEKNKIIEQQEKVRRNREEITHLKKQMSDLTINRNVAIYAYAVQKVNLGEEVHNYMEIIKQVSQDSIVQEYKNLQKELTKLENEIADYYYFIQIDLREKLEDLENPNIYTYYGLLEDDSVIRNIIDAEIIDYDENKTIIMPEKEFKSRRKTRHFYNKISFKYLEALTRDNSFEVEGKDLGKVKILTPERK